MVIAPTNFEMERSSQFLVYEQDGKIHTKVKHEYHPIINNDDKDSLLQHPSIFPETSTPQ